MDKPEVSSVVDNDGKVVQPLCQAAFPQANHAFSDSVTHRYTWEKGKTLVHTQTCVPVCSAVVFN